MVFEFLMAVRVSLKWRIPLGTTMNIPKKIRIECESKDMYYSYCPVDGVVTMVKLVKQFSRSPCIENQTWGYDRHGVWVDNGCRGEFAVYTHRNYRNYHHHYHHYYHHNW